ncbi:MAG TPA: hypothetical protein VK842_07230 [bacterium]|nr:hypothetical protein [bacterium]
MNPHRRALGWAAFFLGLAAALTFVGVDLAVDPYNEFGLSPLRKVFQDHYSGAYAAYAKLESPGVRDLVFGTSLSGTLSPAQLKAPLLNLSSSVYGKPVNILAFLAGLDEAQWSHIRRVYCLVDIRMLDAAPGDYADRDFHSAWQRWTEPLRNINGTKVFRALDDLKQNLNGRMAAYVDADGVVHHLGLKPFQPAGYVSDYGADLSYSPQAGAALRQVDQLLARHLKPVTYFCTVLSDYFWCQVNPATIAPHYQCIVEAVPSFLCLDRVPAFSPRLDLYRDEVHHEDAITDWEAGMLLDPKAARPYVIDKSNYKRHVAALLAQLRRCPPAAAKAD